MREFHCGNPYMCTAHLERVHHFLIKNICPTVSTGRCLGTLVDGKQDLNSERLFAFGRKQ